MIAPTYTVVSGYQDRAGRFWLYLRGLPSPVPSDTAWPEGTAVKIVNGKAVK